MELPRSFGGAACLPIDAVPAPVRAAVLASGESGYVYDLAVAKARAADLIAALPAAARVCYAVKANSFVPLLEALAEVVHGFEVASVAEARLAVAAATKVPKIARLAVTAAAEVPKSARLAVAAATEVPKSARLVASGPAKNRAMLAALVGQEAQLTVNVESLLELHRLSRVAVAAGREVAVALRVNPAQTPVSVDRATGLTMGGLASPFGLPEGEIPAAVAALGALPGVRFVGFHVHAVSGNMDAVRHAEYVRWALAWSVRTAARHGLELQTVDVGGGLGIPFEPGPEFDLAAFGAALPEIPAGIELIFEPGRWLAGPAGWYAAEVVDVKHSYGTAFVVVRGGINHFQLPTSWEIRHNFAVLPVDNWPDGLPRPAAERTAVTVVGELCTPEDVLARDVTVVAVRAGDVLIFPNAGSYGFEFAMPAFLGHPPAARAALAILDGERPGPHPASRVDDLTSMG